MEKDRTSNVAETIGRLVISGYRLYSGNTISYGKYDTMSEITLKKRYAYYGDDDYLQGFDESVRIDITTGDMEISRKPVEKYRRYPSK